MGKIIDLEGQTFGRLTVVKQGDYYISPKGAKVKRWVCECECGNTVQVNTTQLRNGNTKSCGCYQKEIATQNHMVHGMYKKRIYNIYTSMIQRCENSNNVDYHNYGGRGIQVCDEWKNNFEAFYDWAMLHGYSSGLTIDRIDVNGNYEPLNCQWVTYKEQGNNRRNNHLITYNGETHTMAEWADITGINYSILACRILNHKWSVERALTQEVKTRARRTKAS